ncbi:MAG: TIGR01212 family radical SAM protein [Bacteriovoracaceae bacterium]|nr:TIGR01212 family radical SAM protein [Bacteriovoracaceae bacterium]
MPWQKYADYIRRTYHTRVQKITVDAGMTCPNRDGTCGTTGCTYCANQSFAPIHLKNLSLREQIEHGIRLSKHRYKKVQQYFVYFQAYSNTYAPLATLRDLFTQALEIPGVIGLCIGTRPDCVDEAKLALLRDLATAKNVAITLEYGLESILDSTLERINRGHNVACFAEAIHQTHQYNLLSSAHVILGFPWEDATVAAATGEFLSKLPLNFLKIHQLEVIRSTALGNDYLAHPFPCLCEQAYYQQVIDLLTHLRRDIIIERLCNEAPRDLVLAPAWHTSADQVAQTITHLMQQQKVYQGMLAPSSGTRP